MSLAFTLPIVDFEVPIEIVVLGVISGLIYGLLAVGLAFAYRSFRIINFAHGEIGILCASLMLIVVGYYQMPYLIGLATALAAALVVGALIDFLVIRRLTEAPRLVVMVATIGLAQVLFGLHLWLVEVDIGQSYLQAGADSRGTVAASRLGNSFPTPFEATWEIGNLRLGSGQILVIFVVPIVVAGLALFLRRSKIGLAMRASAENLEAANLAGTNPRKTSMVVWAIIALLATISAVLVAPTRPLGTAGALGPSLLVRGLGAGVLGGLTSLPQVFASGVALGVIEGLVNWNYPADQLFDVVLFVLILGAVLIRKDLGRAARGGEGSSWSLGGAIHSLEARIARKPLVRIAKWAFLIALVALAAAIPPRLDIADRILLSAACMFAVVGLSLTVLTGLTGQVSLGQFAFVGIGAYGGGRLNLIERFNSLVEVAIVVAACGLVALVVGIPALRLRGLLLAVTTLAFAIVASNWLLRQSWFVEIGAVESSIIMQREEWFGIDMQNETHYFWLCLGVLVVVALLVSHMRNTGFGRRLVAVRDNETTASALSVPVRRVKLQAFVVSGMIAGLAGYLLAGLYVSFDTQSFLDVQKSLDVVAMVVFGGVTTVTGAVLGAAWIKGVPHFFGDYAGLLSTGFGLLIVLQMLPGGLATGAFRVRDRLVSFVARERVGQLAVSDRAQGIEREPLPPAPETEPMTTAPIRAENITVSFGGLRAVDHVDLHADDGEIVGLLGPNGAGKTTLFDVLTGVIRPETGHIHLHGEDVTSLRPEQRARRGMGRSFQEARLFPEVSLLDTFKIALEREQPSYMIPSVLGLPPSWSAERHKTQRAEEIVDLLGLTPFAARNCGELSTGTRRFAELGCLLAMGCRVLLLDEPTAGIAQREVEAFTPVLREIRAHLGATMVIIDHDIPMMMSLVDRMYVMSAGQVIASGDPEVVRSDPEVVSAYLGTDERAIQRSGALSGSGAADAGEESTSGAPGPT